MKILKSSDLSPFGGLNFVLEEFDKQGIGQLLQENLSQLGPQSQFDWRDIFYSFWSVFFCGGDCAEDLSGNFQASLFSIPSIKTPSPDRVLERMKSLSKPIQIFDTPRGKSKHMFSCNAPLNRLNIRLLKKLNLVKEGGNVLDYDNTIIFSNKADSLMTYKKQSGYCPGVGIIGNSVVYVENRNGNSDAQTLQQDTLERMFTLLEEEGVVIDAFRADSASYQLSTLATISKYADKFYIRARMNESLSAAINQITQWEQVKEKEETAYRGQISFVPFEPTAKRNKETHLLKRYRLVVTKFKRADGQINLFTGQACNYSAIITSDFDKTNDQIVDFYNQRGRTEREFDVLKNDFGWNKMPFSKIEQNTVFLIMMALCRNLYKHIIITFSKKFKNLRPSFRIKKFIFRFICIPAGWIKSGRIHILRIYGNLYFKT